MLNKTIYCAMLTLIALIYSGCMQSESPREVTFSNHPVILISMDTTRVDYVEPFGTKSSTPHIKQLAEDSVRFTNAITTVPLTVPAHASLFTGLYPVETGVRDNFQTVLPSSAVTIAEYFQEEGYTTAGVIGAVLLSESWGLHQGFDFYEDEFSSEEYEAQDHTVERSGEKISALALDWLKKHQAEPDAKPFFLFLHYYDPHQTYNPPEPYKTQYANDLYAGEIAYTDQCIGQIIAYLKENNIYDDAIIALVGDHGESLGEHGENSHGMFLYEAAMRVPMIIKLPKSVDRKNIAVEQQASITDIMPTLLNITGTVPIENIIASGISLRPWLMSDHPVEPGGLLLETQYPKVYNWSPLFALRTNEWKYIQAPKPELYDLQNDPHETNNVFTNQPQQADDMKTQLEEALLTASSTMLQQSGGMVTANRNEQLASLGYVSGGGSSAQESNETEQLPDPKDKIEIHLQFEKGVSLLSKKQYEQAESIFAEIAEQDEKNPSIHHHLAQIYGEQKLWDKAHEAEQKALAIAPDNYTYQLQQAWNLIQLKRNDESRQLLLQIISKQPQLAEAQFLMGINAVEAGKIQEAASYIIRTERIAPNYPGLAEVKEKIKKMLPKDSQN